MDMGFACVRVCVCAMGGPGFYAYAHVHSEYMPACVGA